MSPRRRKNEYWESADKLFHSGMPVKISQSHNFRGFKLGIILGACKKKDGGISVYLASDDLGFREVCIMLDRGDTLVSLTKPPEVDRNPQVE